MGAVGDILNIGDWSRMRMWALAIGVAMLGFNAMVYLGWVEAGKSIYAGNRLIWLSNLLGGALFCVGFAAESQNLLELASAKRMRKGVPLMVGNIGPQTFGQDDNALLLIDAQGVTELPRDSKIALARQLIAHIAQQTIFTIPQTH